MAQHRNRLGFDDVELIIVLIIIIMMQILLKVTNFGKKGENKMWIWFISGLGLADSFWP